MKLVHVTSDQPLQAALETAHRLRSSRMMVSCSRGKKPADQERAIAYAWEQLSMPRPTLSVQIVPTGDQQPWLAELGPHLTRLSAADEERAHRLWTELSKEASGLRPHHSDILSLALKRLEGQLSSSQANELRGELLEILNFQQSFKSVSYYNGQQRR